MPRRKQICLLRPWVRVPVITRWSESLKRRGLPIDPCAGVLDPGWGKTEATIQVAEAPMTRQILVADEEFGWSNSPAAE